MNGVRPRIEIFRPFGEAFDLTNKILFQPFDLKKWLVIGFAAFLSGHLAGVGFNFPSPFGNFQSHLTTPEVISPHFEQWKPWLVVAVVVLGLFLVSIVIFVSIATYFMVPVMYRRRCRAVEAFRDVTRLIWHHLGSFFLLCLFGMVLILAVLMIGAIVTCATCCLAALPYLG